jgi:hypothetical protein
MEKLYLSHLLLKQAQQTKEYDNYQLMSPVVTTKDRCFDSIDAAKQN